MNNLSSNSIKNLGKKLRDGSTVPQDLDLLDTYRSQFDKQLLETAQSITDILDQHKIKHLLSGRTKRTKSIIRKLVRERHSGMDLSRMSDIVGIRVIFGSLDDQNLALKLLSENIPLVREPYDYRERETGYRAIHLIAGDTNHRVEIQLRTCAQHYWADESERLGEQVKEGNANQDEAAYLNKLNNFCKAIDHRQNHEAFQSDADFSSGYNRLHDQFISVTNTLSSGESASFVVVYHEATNALIRIDAFAQSERSEALKYFRDVSRSLDESQYDILVLNTGTRKALSITHPRYFPEQSY